jgi:hypothetical protein
MQVTLFQRHPQAGLLAQSDTVLLGHPADRVIQRFIGPFERAEGLSDAGVQSGPKTLAFLPLSFSLILIGLCFGLLLHH